MSPSAHSGRGTVLLAVAAAGFCAFIDLYSTQSLLPLLGRTFGAPEVAVSLTVSASTFAVALSAPLIGLFADRIGRKRIIVTAIFALSVPTFLAATSSSLPGLVFWRFLQGLLLPGIFAVTIAYISEESPAGTVGSTMAAYMSGSVVGGFMGRFISGLVAAHLNWRWSFVALGLLTLIGGAVVTGLLPRSRRFARQQSTRQGLGAMRGHLGNWRVLATCAVGFGVLFSLVGTFTYISFHLAAPPFHLGTDALGSMFLVYLLGVFVTPVAGRWIDRIGTRRTLVAAVALSASGVLLTLAPSLWSIVCGLAIASTGVFICQSAAMSQIGTVAGGARSSAAGLYVASYYAGGSAGGVVPGAVWDLGGWPACVMLVIVVQAITAAIGWFFWRDRDRDASEPVASPANP